MIPRWQADGYHVTLLFLALLDADMAIARVAERVRQGGHFVPDDVVRTVIGIEPCVSREERSCRRVGIHGGVDVLVEQSAIKMAHFTMLNRSAHVRLPTDSVVDRQMGIGSPTVLSVQSDVVITLQVVADGILIVRIQVAQQEVGKRYSCDLPAKRERSIRIDVERSVLNRTNPIYAHRELMRTLDQAKVVG